MDTAALLLALVLLIVGLVVGAGAAAASVRASLRPRLAAAADAVMAAEAQAEAMATRMADAVAVAEAARARAHAAEVAQASAEGQRDTAASQARRAEDTARASGALTAALGPLAERLDLIGRQVGQLETDRTVHLSKLSEQIRTVVSVGEGLQSQTASLAGALRSSNSRGTWGEVQLLRIVEAAGMLPRVDFDTQATSTTVDGSRVRPDMTVHLPGGRGIAIDAKAPLVLPDPSVAQVDPTAQAAEQCRKLRGHISTLGSKQYWTALPSSPEFVVCFLPTESILSDAVRTDPGLLDFAMDAKVVLASPLTLLALLKTVAMTWREQAVHENAEQMLAMGRELYQRLGKVAEHADGVGRALETAATRYNTFVGSFEQRLLVTARRMTDLGLSGDVPEPRPVEAAVKPFTSLELVGERIDFTRAGARAERMVGELEDLVQTTMPMTAARAEDRRVS